MQDLHLFCGPGANVSRSLAACLDRTKTEMGRIFLMKRLSDPVADISVLRARQELVQEIVENEKLFKELMSMFDVLNSSETLMLSFWKQDILTYYARRKSIRTPVAQNLVDTLHKNSLFMEFYERIGEIQDLCMAGSACVATALLPLCGLALLSASTRPYYARFRKLTTKTLGISVMLGFSSLMRVSTWILENICMMRNRMCRQVTQCCNDAAIGVDWGMVLYNTLDLFRSNVLLLECLQTKCMHLARYLDAFQRLQKIIDNNPVLCKQFAAGADALDAILYNIPQEIDDLRELLNILQTETFKGEPSFFSRAGRILAALVLFDEHKDKFLGAMLALAEIDVLLSTAQLYKEGQQCGASWCFPSYHESSVPYAILDAFWNPCIDPSRAVHNTLSLGIDGNPPCIIFTGPNAGGKSTAMTAIVESFIIGQTLGIVPAKRAVFTPFNKIMTYLKITDDIAAGNSHFKAGVLRAREILAMLDDLKADEFGFIALDEVFNGTTYSEGQAAAYSLIDTLGRDRRILCVTATHFPVVSRLEQSASAYFKNYKVIASYTASGELVYPFKIEAGVADQSIAFDVLKNAGFKEEFLTKARTVAAYAQA